MRFLLTKLSHFFIFFLGLSVTAPFLSSNRDQTAGFVLLIEPMGDGKNGVVRRSFLQGFHHQGFCAAV